MSFPNPYEKYQNQSINTATPEELTLMLYNGCIKFINIAEIAITEKDFEVKNTNLQKAQAIIEELSMTLNMDVPVSKNLKQLYDFIHSRLLDANIRNDKGALLEAKDIVSEMRDTWKEAMKIARTK